MKFRSCAFEVCCVKTVVKNFDKDCDGEPFLGLTVFYEKFRMRNILQDIFCKVKDSTFEHH